MQMDLYAMTGDTLDMTLRLGAAVVAAAALGLERERQHKPAGLRTHMLVSLGAAASTLVALALIRPGQFENELLRVDPIRVVEGVIGGIGFLGAGSIIRSQGSVGGLTTAASIWVAGAIGLTCGAGQFRLAFLTVLFAFIILRFIAVVERKIIRDGEGKRETERKE